MKKKRKRKNKFAGPKDGNNLVSFKIAGLREGSEGIKAGFKISRELALTFPGLIIVDDEKEA